MTAQPNPADRIFQAALKLPLNEREEFINRECRGDESLKERVLQLLQEHELAERTETLGTLAEGELEDRTETLETVKLNTQDLLMNSEQDPDREGSFIGPYQLIEKIGEGGFGVVYMAEQFEPVRRKVAIKILKKGMDSHQIMARFEQERQALAMMDHSNIAKIYDAGSSLSGRPYFVMEWVQGMPITTYCDQHKLDIQKRLQLFQKVCRAIQYAHHKGIIHRDIKPSNVLVTLDDGVPTPKVIDFGIAKAIEQKLTDDTIFTKLQHFIGTPAYMSPEQADMSGIDIDTRSDIYSLGVLLYELLSGKTPFDTQSLLKSGLDEMRRLIREVDPPVPSLRITEKEETAILRQSATPKLSLMLRGDLDWIAMKALEKDRARRYETANDLLMDIERYLKNEPVLAAAPSIGYQFRKFILRNKASVTSIAAIVLILIVSTIFSSYQAYRANRETIRAEKSEKEAIASAKAEAESRRKAVLLQEEAEKKEQEAIQEREVSERLLYAANMNLAQKAWEENSFIRLRQVLKETESYPSRSFEWRFLKLQCELEQLLLKGHWEYISAVSISPDGKSIASSSGDRTFKIWDALNGKELFTLKKHQSAVYDVQYSPDGQKLVTAGVDSTARIWNALNGDELVILKGHRGTVFSAAFSPDGKTVLTGGGDRTARLWNVETGEELLRLTGHSGQVQAVCFSPDGSQLVTGAEDQQVKIWNRENGKERFTLNDHPDEIIAVACTPDGTKALTASARQNIKVWDLQTGELLFTLQDLGDSAPLFSLGKIGITSDSRYVITGGKDLTACVWDLTTRKKIRTLRGHNQDVSSVDISADGSWVVTGSFDNSVRTWTVKDRKDQRRLPVNNKFVRAAAFSPDGKRVVTGSSDNKARIWNAMSGEEERVISGHFNYVMSVAWSPDGTKVFTGSWDGGAAAWDPNTGENLNAFIGHKHFITSLDLSQDGRRLVTGSRDGTAKVWDTESGEEIVTLKGEDFGSSLIEAVAISPDGTRVAVGGESPGLNVWDVESRELLLTLFGHRGAIHSVVFALDGSRINSGARGAEIIVWDAATGKNLQTLTGHNRTVAALAISRDGQRLFSGSFDKTCKVWDLVSGRELITLEGEDHFVTSLDVSPDGKNVVIAGDTPAATIFKAEDF